ncbi:dipeptidyl aminopeptidase/acylaminoacyl peptidase [Mesoflavibacter sabulilitoris]|uniref:S9 family peptidase n=1 Tax=Mesoflavibacter zeaxanthinifaciens subsp. sabulilitoris TaxID=1520893 RepID=A0A2T1NAZ1_9FLAO|nr:prolyl oligopeptidase family serine peptidase [Mesoflavibacter zeaxanthinifaciens]MBB3123609.1 dipeptidyl aminopeptidase/acylaminoacyl peptidase [Mesoflavibacter zeaxanthinifaciens subsp. sabulilitoris]PSG89263.1 S9 family peptidase [Mesoflavibacter zeaxanthinifaciens subsp. sabulilitoris]
MAKSLIKLLLIFVCLYGYAQQNLTYQKPSKEILELADADLAPGVQIDSKGEHMVLLYRNQYKSIEELSETELRLAGLRINPVTNIGSRTNYYTNLKVKQVKDKEAKQVKGLPDNARLSNFSWSPDESLIACLNTTPKGVEVWIVNIENANAYKISNANVNANMRSTINWFKDNKHLLVKMLPNDRKELINTATAVPSGPTVSVSNGAKAQNRTYQDLLKTPNDEFNFEQLARSEIKKLSINGEITDFLDADMYRGISFSPDGNYIMVTKIKRPFSYLVTYSRFPSESNIYDLNGKFVKTVNNVPLDEVRPKGFMATRTGKRSMQWRSDKPATIVWAEALDKGDPEVKVDYRDVVYQLDAPFNGQPKEILKTKQRFSGIRWGNDNIAIAFDYWWNTRNLKTYLFNPTTAEAKIISDRNYQDVYSDPGDFVSSKNKYGSYTLTINGDNLYLMGDGYSKEGQFPFIDEYNIKTGKTKRLYKSKYTDKLESLNFAIDMKKGDILVRIESKTDYPNYYIRNIKKNKLTAITDFDNPFKSLESVDKRVINYKRNDGLDLEGTLYLPLDYKEGEKYPMILWAYPREYKDKASASQSTANPNEFVYPYWGSPIYWVTKGYVVLDDAAFPIVGEGNKEPNDTFITQLVANAKAAIDAVDNLGYIDPNKVAVGGHSYGAFMTANLLSHSNLFAAGIARSGAYNRTLTPFGFQSEERSYWEAPEIYNTMSPFMNADKIKTPLLLIHGVADNNSGTYPLQSERYFNALKGLGAPVRLVMLPKESHGYRAKESIMHMLWEQDQWLEKHVKNKK